MGDPNMDGTGGMPDFGGEKGMKDVFNSFFKPRRENDPNRKVGRNELYGRLNPKPPSSDGMG